VVAEDEDIATLREQVVLKDTTDKKNDEVKDERSQWREKPIIVGRKEVKDNEKEIEGEKEKGKKKKKNLKKIKKRKRVRVKKQEKREKKQLQMRERKFHTLWYLPRKIRNTTWRDS